MKCIIIYMKCILIYFYASVFFNEKEDKIKIYAYKITVNYVCWKN